MLFYYYFLILFLSTENYRKDEKVKNTESFFFVFKFCTNATVIRGGRKMWTIGMCLFIEKKKISISKQKWMVAAKTRR